VIPEARGLRASCVPRVRKTRDDGAGGVMHVSNVLADSIAQVAARISALLGPRAMRAVARLNRWVTNPIQRLWAPPSTAASATG